MATLTDSAVITVIPCASCGIRFGVPEDWRSEREENGGGFYCPNGHSLSYRDSEVKKLQRKLDQERAARLAAEDQAQAAERSRVALKGELTKVKNRIAKGVCPECHRHFQNVERHMKSKHPDFAASQS